MVTDVGGSEAKPTAAVMSRSFNPSSVGRVPSMVQKKARPRSRDRGLRRSGDGDGGDGDDGERRDRRRSLQTGS
jgi:hypothetical protein